MSGRLNYYILLEIDPGEQDPSTIMAHIEKKKKNWSKAASMGSPKARRQAKSHLDLLSDIKKVMGNPQSRAEEARSAKVIINRAQQEKGRRASKELGEMIEVLRDVGICKKEQYDELVSRFGDFYKPEKIRSYLEKAGVVVTGLVEDTLDAPTARVILENLEHLEKKHLFEFLCLEPGVSGDVLFNKADAIEKEYRRSGKIDQVSTARGELAAICKVLFREKKGYRRYMNFMVSQIMVKFDSKISIVGAGGKISGRQLKTLVGQATERGVAPLEARTYIETYAQKKGIVIMQDIPIESVPTRSVSKGAAPTSQSPEGVENRPMPRIKSARVDAVPTSLRQWSFTSALTLPFHLEKPAAKILSLMLISYIPVFGFVILHGWRQDLIRRTCQRRSLWPESGSLARHLSDGMVLWLIIGLYGAPALAILALTYSNISFASFSAALTKAMLLPFAVLLPAWLLYQAGKIRYAQAGGPFTLLNIFSNLATILSNPVRYIKLIVLMAINLWGVVFVGFLLAMTGIGFFLIPGLCIPLYYWSTGFTLGHLAPATVKA